MFIHSSSSIPAVYTVDKHSEFSPSTSCQFDTERFRSIEYLNAFLARQIVVFLKSVQEERESHSMGNFIDVSMLTIGMFFWCL